MDYMRITWAPLALMAELRRTTDGRRPRPPLRRLPQHGPDLPLQGPARRVDGARRRQRVPAPRRPWTTWCSATPSTASRTRTRPGSCRRAAGCPRSGAIPVLEFLWRDDTVVPRDPAPTTAAELPRERLFPGVGHLVLRDGWGPDSTWIAVLLAAPTSRSTTTSTRTTSSIYHKGHLALDTGADYTDTESPHYLNYYRRTVAHNTMLVYQPGRDVLLGREPVAGRQRRRPAHGLVALLELGAQPRGLAAHARPLGPRAHRGLRSRARPLHLRARRRHAAPTTRARSSASCASWSGCRGRACSSSSTACAARTRPTARPGCCTACREPQVEGGGARRERRRRAARSIGDARVVTFEDGQGRLRVHSMLPVEREVIVRGGPGFEFWTPGDERGGAWGSRPELAARSARGRARCPPIPT